MNETSRVSGATEAPRCAPYHDLILLEHSGELQAWGRFRLRRHLSACAPCRAYREDLLRLCDVARLPDTAAQPAESALRRIRLAAGQEIRRPAEIRWRALYGIESFRPALVYATLSVLVLFGFWLVIRPALEPHPASVAVEHPSTTEWEDDLDEQIAEVRLLLAELVPSDASNGEEINAMAEELLILEGNI